MKYRDFIKTDVYVNADVIGYVDGDGNEIDVVDDKNILDCDVLDVNESECAGVIEVVLKTKCYKEFDFWNKEKLWKLRTEIVLGSLFVHHYENSFGIPDKVCCDFFDSFVEWCWIIEGEEENGLTEWKDVLAKYDNADELWDYFYGMEYPFGE